MGKNFYFDHVAGSITLDDGVSFNLDSHQAFDIVSDAWLRAGWDTKYVYSFSWLGRPIIQLPDDLIRIQEMIYSEKPDVLIETGVAHGGSLVFFASLMHAMNKGKVVGVDIEIRSHNRTAIEEHEMFSRIALVEGNSTAASTLNAVGQYIEPGANVMVILDSSHTREHVFSELSAYSRWIRPGGWIVVCDGIMKDLKGAPRSNEDWDENNPVRAISDFLSERDDFEQVEPGRMFNEGVTQRRVTYWPGAFLRRKAVT